MISKYSRLKAALAIEEKQLKEWCNEIEVSKSTVIRYFNGKRVRYNHFLEDKLEELWKSAIKKINTYEEQKHFREKIKKMRT